MRILHMMCCVMFMIGCGGGKAEVKADAEQVEAKPAALNPDGISGSYIVQYSIAVGDDERGYTATDMPQCIYVEQAEDKQSIMFRLELQEDNGKGCSLAGSAQLDVAESSEDYKDWRFKGEAGCTLQIVSGAGSITVVDDDGTCKAAYCKNNHEISRVQFLNSSRAAGDLCAGAGSGAQ
jgi:hypothetical protein